MISKPGQFSLDPSTRQESGRIYLSGIQALVRLPLDQHRRPTAAGGSTRRPSSPATRLAAGRFDQTLEREKKLLEAHQGRSSRQV